MNVPIAGLELTPDPEDPNKCFCRQVIEYEHGDVPSYIENIVSWQKA